MDGKELFTTMMAETARLDPHIFLAIEKLKGKKSGIDAITFQLTFSSNVASGKFTIAALTNNFDLPEDDLKEAEAMGASAANKLRALFDYFIESRLIGLRYA